MPMIDTARLGGEEPSEPTALLLRNYIDGELQNLESGTYLDNVEPATATVFSRVPDSGPDVVDDAVQAAKRAFPAWAALPAEERANWMLRLAAAVEERLEAFAKAESRDTGKPLALARTVDIPRAVRNLRFFATAVLHQQSESHVTDTRALNYTLRHPIGVAGCISPWNLPLYLFTWKIAPALAAGNTVVGKPSELTPYTATLLGEVCRKLDFPNGVLNIVHGRGSHTGAALIEHPDVRAISFTGGTATGRIIGETAARQFKKVSLELGGKNPNLVFADADLDQAIAESVRAAFSNQGQICLCGSRILVEAPVYERFLEGFIPQVRALRVGDPLEPSTQQGAVVSAAHRGKVLNYVQLALEEGGTVVTGGGPPRQLPARCRDGYFIEPTVITDLGPQCRVSQEEIFGPVVTVAPFESESEAVSLANGTPYGLAATIWTRDLDRAHRVAAALDSGIVWVNCWMLRDLRTPFGGVKQSGVGREGGEEALRFFTESKNVCIALAREERRR